MASVWYNSIPCVSCETQKPGVLTVAATPNDREVVITIGREKGKPVKVRLAPGWARVLADLIQQSALQVQYKPPASEARSESRRLRAA